MQRSLEEEAATHEQAILDLRAKYQKQLEDLSEVVEQQKKARTQLEKLRGGLEAEKHELDAEVKSVQAAKQVRTKRKAEEVPPEMLDEIKKKATKDVEAIQKQLDEALSAKERAERSKTKLQQEVGLCMSEALAVT